MAAPGWIVRIIGQRRLGAADEVCSPPIHGLVQRNAAAYMSVRRPAALRALRHRDFARFAAARFCATLGWQMLSVAVGWQVYEFTGDPLALGLVGLAQFLPFVALVLPAGQIADRADRRLILVLSYAVEALCALALFALALLDLRITWPIFVAMLLFGAARAFWMPAGQAMTPNLVPAEDFSAAVAVNSALFQVSVIAGPAIGGLLFLAGAEIVYGSVLLLLVLVVVLMLRIRPVRVAGSGDGYHLRDALEGLRFVIRNKPLLGAISLDLFAVLLGGATALLPVYASDVQHIARVDRQQRCAAHRPGGPRHPAHGARGRRGRGCGVARGGAALAPCRALDVLRHGTVRLRDRRVRPLHVVRAVARSAGPARCGRHAERVHPPHSRAARDSRQHPRARQRRERDVHRHLERAR